MRRKVVLSILSLCCYIMMSGCHYFAFHHHHESYHHHHGHSHHRHHHLIIGETAREERERKSVCPLSSLHPPSLYLLPHPSRHVLQHALGGEKLCICAHSPASRLVARVVGRCALQCCGPAAHRPSQGGQRLDMIRIGQQALLCERNDIVDTPETTLYFQEDIAEDIFLPATATAHFVHILDGRGHKLSGAFDIAAHERQLPDQQTLPNVDQFRCGPSGSRRKRSICCCAVKCPGARQGQANPVMHPDRQVVGLFEQPFPLRRQVFPHCLVDRRLTEHLQAPHQLDALEQRQGRRGRGPVVTREPLITQDGLGLLPGAREYAHNIRVRRHVQSFERVAIVAACLVGMPDGMIGVEIGGVER